MKKYDVILADPPWDFRVWDKDTGSGRSASAHYQYPYSKPQNPKADQLK